MYIDNNIDLTRVRSLHANEPFIGWYLVKVTGTLALQELLVAPHGNAQGVDGLIPMMIRSSNYVPVLPVELLDLPL